MKFRSIFVLFISILLILGCLSGCTMGAPEQINDSLTISCYGTASAYGNDIINTAANRFRQLYPEVSLTIQREPFSETDGGEAYYTKLNTEVMAGKGPDLFWIDPNYMDPYKMMKAGALADLRGFMEADQDFSWADYNQTLLSAGCYKEAQYVIPLYYSIPLLLADAQILEQVGFDAESCTDFMSLWSELSLYTEQYLAMPEELPKPFRLIYKLNGFPNYTGLDWTDYENSSIHLDAPEWQEIFDGYKGLYSLTSTAEFQEPYSSFSTSIWLSEGTYLFEIYSGNLCYIELIRTARGLCPIGEAQLIPVYDINGGIQAQITQAVGVSRNSPNQENAYRFLKLLLAPEAQSATNDFVPQSFPLSNQALDITLSKCEEELSAQPGQWAFSGSGEIPEFGAVSPELVSDIRQAVQKISGAYFETDTRSGFRRQMIPYLTGEKDYDKALKEAQKTLQVYISE